MSPLDWIAFGIFVLIAVGAVRLLPRTWRHELKQFDRMPSWWPWGKALWRGWLRMMPISTVAMVVGVVVYAGLLLVPEAPSGPFVRPYWAVVPALAALAIVFGMMLTVVLFNWPKRVVPPHLRSQPGAIEEWWRRRRGRPTSSP